MEVVWLKSQGKAPAEISQLARVSVATVYRYLGEYRAGGIEQVKTVKFYRPTSELVAHQSTIEAYLRAHPPASIKEAAHQIEQLTGVKRGPTQVSEFLKKLGLKRRKVGMLPAKADPEVQAQFKQEVLEPLLDEAKAGKKKSIL